MKGNVVSLDILRGLAVFLMILFHVFMEWMNWAPRDYGFFRDIMVFFGFLAPPFFLIISGMAYYFFIKRKINESVSKLNIFSKVIKRSLFIFVVPTVLQIGMEIIFNIELTNVIYWSIFQVIAFSMILFFSFLFIKPNLKRIFCFSLIILIFFLDFIISYHNYNDLSILDEGVFAFIPWASFYILGLLFGDLISGWRQEHINKKVIISIIAGLGGIIIFFIWVIIYPHSYYFTPSFTHFPPYFMLMIGIFIILFSVCYYWIDIKGKVFYLQNSVIHWSKLSFSIFYIHFGFIALGILVFPLIISESYFYGFSIYQFIILIILFFLSNEIFIRIWKRYNYFLGLEWSMNKISKKNLFLKKFHKG
ncbi:hypothetical protein LCGC14_2038810 [marine sediment metagenome]|uniref:Heparan-alpha-glucosaminide N-acetyltransferase catalytic domain-containing protein n=1 Tax=marine sediment metagenome TaxID=412755 RepID=A0A0F9HPK0_9ZZZZ